MTPDPTQSPAPRRPLRARLGPVRSRAGLTTAGAALLLLVGSANGLLLAWQSTVQHRITHTLSVDRTLMQVLADLLDSETGQRGYLLTGDSSFLVPYTAGQARIAAELPVLDAELRGSAPQEARLKALRPAIARKFVELDRTLALDRAGDRDGALALVRAGEGKTEMDEIRRIIEAMRAQEDEVLLGYQRHAHGIEAMVGIGSVVSVGIMALLAVLALRETARRAALSRFLPAELAPLLERGGSMAQGGGLRLGERRHAAIAFVDMRGSTTIAERADPETVAILVTGFRRCVAQAARETGGVIDKFMGDGALVVFGVPEARAEAAAQGLAFAERLEEGVAAWNAESGEAPVRIGIGVHCGEVFVGVVGDDDRLEFTVLGDAVNVAARLEQATKTFGTTTLVSQAALDAAQVSGGAWASGEAWREVSRQPLRGRREAFPIYGRAA
ncbi:adenylate/guanylate cyclase domain-containing protein [Methylobacterium sp. SyP6R]|uniref:adenylate/guanylate cyclase domain-containing protein n=1 Tax=Methylobacterium sp. SyP6R TaxID=2718876 RepID=UPI001F47145D|nr:CHASE3 domain-containing protein [Methylobacterium sp. SyP6R]MCF4127189.1 CHASE3 domain-containing protein [Methylobacterium sp. SyP6R]